MCRWRRSWRRRRRRAIPPSFFFESRVHLSGPKSAAWYHIITTLSVHSPRMPHYVSIRTPTTAHPHPPSPIPRLIVNFTAQCPDANRDISRSPCVPRGLTDGIGIASSFPLVDRNSASLSPHAKADTGPRTSHSVIRPGWTDSRVVNMGVTTSTADST
jgi:hypothetical protein